MIATGDSQTGRRRAPLAALDGPAGRRSLTLTSTDAGTAGQSRRRRGIV